MQAGQASARTATGVLVVPAAGVEGMAPEPVESPDGRQLRPVEDSRGLDDVAGADAVAAVGRDDPPLRVVVPPRLRHARLEAGVTVEVELGGERLGVGED